MPHSQGNSAYWDKFVRDSDREHGVRKNKRKFDILLDVLSNYPEFVNMEKADIGCGIGIHAVVLNETMPGWKDKWTGFDISPISIEYAKAYGLEAYLGDFGKLGHKKKYDVFLFLDSLEHIEDEDSIADGVRRTANDRFFIFGNVPLYHTELSDGGFERKMDINVVKGFVKKCGANGFLHHVYGINGFPYLMFMADNK